MRGSIGQNLRNVGLFTGVAFAVIGWSIGTNTVSGVFASFAFTLCVMGVSLVFIVAVINLIATALEIKDVYQRSH